MFPLFPKGVIDLLAQYRNLPLWQQAAPVGQDPAVQDAAQVEQSDSDPEQYIEVARQTRELLEKKGYCLWCCHQLNDEIVLVTQDERMADMPLKYAVYTLTELSMVAEMKVNTLRLIHAVKRHGARILSVERINV